MPIEPGDMFETKEDEDKEGQTMIKVNINNSVKVKLTEQGILILKREHDELNKRIIEHGGKGLGFRLELDENGYCKEQLWSLMQKFGKYMRMGENLPFSTTILLDIDNE